MKVLTKVETWLPVFNGFYESGLLDDNEPEYWLFNDPDSVKPESLEWFTDNVYDYIDYESYKNDLAESICDMISESIIEQLPVESVKFQSLQSPKQYNFSNDSINIEASVDLEALIALCRDNTDFNDYIKGHYTSYDGFMSHYDNDPVKWLSSIQDDLAHKVGAIMDCLLDFDYMDIHEASSDIFIGCYVDYDKMIDDYNDHFETNIKSLSDLE